MEHLDLLSNQKLSSFLTFLAQEVTTLPGVKLVGPLALACQLQKNLQQWPTIYIDGGVDFQELYPAKHRLSLGDGDSTKSHLEALDVLYPEDKDQSDLALALALLKDYPVALKLIGFTGGRREHEWSLIGEVISFLKSSKCRSVCWDNHSLFIAAGTARFKGKGRFSLFSLETKGVRLSGAVKFPVDPPKPFSALSSLGLSNEAQGEFEITTLTPLLITWGEGLKFSLQN